MKKTTEEPPPAPSPLPFVGMLCGILYFFEIERSHLIFSTLFPLYLYSANRIRFDENRPAISANKIMPFLLCHYSPEKSQQFAKRYIPFFALTGVVLPLIQIGLDRQSNSALLAVPHLFVLLAQICCEHASSYLKVHEYVRCLGPIGFSLYRQGILYEWVLSAYDTTAAAVGAVTFQAKFGLALSVLNLVMWTYNCFVFLLLRMMPIYLDSERFPVANVEWKVGLIPNCPQPSKMKP